MTVFECLADIFACSPNKLADARITHCSHGLDQVMTHDTNGRHEYVSMKPNSFHESCKFQCFMLEGPLHLFRRHHRKTLSSLAQAFGREPSTSHLTRALQSASKVAPRARFNHPVPFRFSYKVVDGKFV